MKNFNFTIKEEAKNEIFDAYLFYEEKKINLGKRFLESLENYLSSIQLNPKIFAEKYKEFRQAIVNKFPFVV
ncbi:MAG: type II toxin-antitoxin system RelE/ParE family toxin, partial [Bacteroidota bacterium]|nr:type II toxin-antitoxin system RelE/ParE family toxin [Bacteroidota bacterium]